MDLPWGFGVVQGALEPEGESKFHEYRIETEKLVEKSGCYRFAGFLEAYREMWWPYAYPFHTAS